MGAEEAGSTEFGTLSDWVHFGHSLAREVLASYLVSLNFSLCVCVCVCVCMHACTCFVAQSRLIL